MPLDLNSLLSGLAGAVLGLVGAYMIQWRATSESRAAAARAVFMEVASNSSALNMSRTSGVHVPLADSTWLAEQARLAHGLSPAEFVVVATFYMRVGLIRGRGFPAGGAPVESLQLVAEEAFRRSAEAASILESRGWRPRDRAALRDKLKDLVVKS
jgi:hypothetical protein